MALNPPPGGPLQAIDVKVSIPELDDIGPFWMNCPPHRTFAELLQDSVNRDEARRSLKIGTLLRGRTSRHFWCGETLMLRSDTLAAGLSKAAGKGADANGSRPTLVLWPDLYKVGPPQHTLP